MSVAAFALFALLKSDFKPEQTLFELKAFESSVMAEVQKSTSPTAYAEGKAKVAARARWMVENVRLTSVRPIDCLSLAQIYDLGELVEPALKAADKFIAASSSTVNKDKGHVLAVSISAKSDRYVNEVLKHTKAFSYAEPQTAMKLANMWLGQPLHSVTRTRGVIFAVEQSERVRDRVLAMPELREDDRKQINSSYSRILPHFLADADQLSEAIKRVDRSLVGADEGLKYELNRDRRLYQNRLNLVMRPFPELVVSNAHGNFDRGQLKGKVVILDFFAHYCGPCIAAFPHMKKLYADLHPKGLEMVGVTKYYGYYQRQGGAWLTAPQELEKMQGFFQQHQLPYPVVFVDENTFESYGVVTVPLVILIDKTGKVRTAKLGYRTEQFAAFRKEIERLLAE